MAIVRVEWAGCGLSIGSFIVTHCHTREKSSYTLCDELGMRMLGCIEVYKQCDAACYPQQLVQQARQLQYAVFCLLKHTEKIKQDDLQLYLHSSGPGMTSVYFASNLDEAAVALKWQPSEAVALSYQKLWQSINATSDNIVLAVAVHPPIDMAMCAVEHKQLPQAFENLSESMRAELQVVTQAVAKCPRCIEYVAEKAKSKELLLSVGAWMTKLHYTPRSLLSDKDYFVQWAGKNFGAKSCFPKRFRNDKDVVLAGLCCMFKQGWSRRQFEKYGAAEEAVPNNFVPRCLLGNEDFMRRAMQVNPFMLCRAPRSLKTCPDAIATVMHLLHPELDQHVANVFKSQSNHKNTFPDLQGADAELQANLFYVLHCVKLDGMQLEFASVKLACNKIVIRSAFSQNNYSIQFSGKAPDFTRFGIQLKAQTTMPDESWDLLCCCEYDRPRPSMSMKHVKFGP